MKESGNTLTSPLRNEINHYVASKKFIGIQYFTDIREYVSTTAIIKNVIEREGAEYLQLATGTEIRLDRIIRLDGKPAPGFENYFTCEC